MTSIDATRISSGAELSLFEWHEEGPPPVTACGCHRKPHHQGRPHHHVARWTGPITTPPGRPRHVRGRLGAEGGGGSGSAPVSDLFGVGGRELLDRLEFPEPWRGDIEASLRLIDELNREITGIEKDLRAVGAHHPYVPLLMSLPGAGWILAYTIAAEIGDIARFQSPTKLVGYTGLCPRVYQSGETDHRGSLAKCGPRYLRWALIEAAVHGARHSVYQERYERTARRLGRQLRVPVESGH